MSMYFDAHIHSAVSPDSQMEASMVIDALRRQGLGTTFTEHCDFPPYNFMVDFDRYEREYRTLRCDSVLMGLELTLNEEHHAQNAKIAAGDWDFILGSIHYVDGLNLFYESDAKPANTLIHRYLTYMKDMVESSGFFDSLAHIDYICRYSTAVDEIFTYENYPEAFDAVFTALATCGLAMEISTKRLGNARNGQCLYKLYKRFAELGGRYVTIGSDAHLPEQLGNNFIKAREIADEAGLSIVYFRERKRYECK